MCSIVVSFFTNLSLYIKSKKSRSLEFHLDYPPLLCELSIEFDFSGEPEKPY